MIVAAVQAAPVFLDLEASVGKAARLIEEAGASGARIVAFPETWLPGYPAWIHGLAGWDDPLAKRLFARLQRNSVEVPGPAAEALARAARRAGAAVVIGINEREAAFSRGTLFNSLLFIAADGELLGVHRKLVPTHAERIVWGQGDGSTLHVLDTPHGRLGGLVCWEHWMPLARFAMHAKGEEVHVAAWPAVGELHQLASRHYAFEGRCFVICVGARLTDGDLPDEPGLAEAMLAGVTDPPEGGLILAGGSGVIGPDGAWLAGPIAAEETIVYAEVDLSQIAAEQLALDAAGHYNRPDVFSLSVDERPRMPVDWVRGEDRRSRPRDVPDGA